jgi:1-acyl-sn-glycerol-3-phosphate acyltransferase
MTRGWMMSRTQALLRLVAWLVVRAIYRLEKTGLGHVPAAGPAVLVCNHVSFVDALIITAACRRPVRFVMDHRIFRAPLVSLLFRAARAIPIAPARDDPALLEKAYGEIARTLEKGDLVCLFPEGRITANGEMNPFRGGIKRIVERTPVPVVPVALRGLWGSFFSRKGGPAMSRLSRLRLGYRVGLAAGESVPPQQVTPEGLQARVLRLRGDWR